MKVSAVWPDCDYLNREWVYDRNKAIDSYWVQCSPKEVEEEILPLLTEESVELMKGIEKTYGRSNPHSPDKFFLVAKDLSSVEPFNWAYPFHHMWNAYSPFEKVNEFVIDDLHELATAKKKEK